MIGSWASNYDDNGFYVVQDVGTGEDLLMTPNEYAGDKAVAELASYAPEMLEALKGVTKELDDTGHIRPLTCTLIRELVLKVEGGQS